MAHGGEAIARRDGKAHFVAGAVPGDTVEVEIIRDKGNWARGDLVEVTSESPDRVPVRCKHFGTCGGCNWQMTSYEAQLRYKRNSVAGQLSHLGQIDSPRVNRTVSPGEPFGYRNRMDFRVLAGRVALGRPRTRDTVALDECHLLHPDLAEVFHRLGDLSGAQRVTLRMSESSGQRLIIIDGDVPGHAATWGTAVARREGRKVVPIIGDAILRHRIGDLQFRVSGTAFFQVNTAGAAVLLDLVSEALDPQPDDVLLDAYAGGGLFAVGAGRRAGSILAIERDDAAVGDLRHNLETAKIDIYEVIKGDTKRVLQGLDAEVDIAVVDPPRSGLGAEVVKVLSEWSPRTLAYVSCDPASLARDAVELTKAGYELDWATPVDLFPQTHHIETVARFVR